MHRPITILAFILLIGNEDTGTSPEVNGQDQSSKLVGGGDNQESGDSQSSIDRENRSGQKNESGRPSRDEQIQDGQLPQAEQEQDEQSAQDEQNEEEELAAQTGESTADETKFFMNDQEAAKEGPLIHREVRWRPFAFRWFDHMDNQIFREYKYGFPPGIYGSSLIPISIWYQLWGMKTVDAMFLQPKNLVLLTIDYVKMINSCSERENPRCSWHYFLALLHPLGYHKKLLKFLVPSVDTLHGYEYYPVPVVHGACYPFTSIDQISLIYIYHICHYYQSDNSGNLELHQLCPNPCLKHPCKLIDRAVDGSCVSYGFHKNDFRCTCEEGFEWEDSTLLCSVVDTCSKICNQTTTSSCLVNRTSATAICQCVDGFMGFDCSQPYDACVLGSAPDARGLNVGPIIPSGYDACGTTLDASNLCVPKASTYVCVCSPAYVRDVTVPYDNCLKPLDSCEKRICVHGQCVTAPDLLKSVCDCDDGYTGSKCDLPTGSWSQWSHWGACEPSCGPARHKRRQRLCLSEREGDCVGPMEEISRCESGLGCIQDVPVEEETWFEFMDWTNYVMIITLGYIGALAIFLSILGLCRRYKAKTVESGHRSKYSLRQSSYSTRGSGQSGSRTVRPSSESS